MTVAENNVELPPVTLRRNVPHWWRRLRRSVSAWCGAILTAIFLLLAIAGEAAAPFSANQTFDEVAQKPSSKHWLGTDDLQKDVLSRVIAGSRLSLVAGSLSIIL